MFPLFTEIFSLYRLSYIVQVTNRLTSFQNKNIFNNLAHALFICIHLFFINLFLNNKSSFPKTFFYNLLSVNHRTTPHLSNNINAPIYHTNPSPLLARQILERTQTAPPRMRDPAKPLPPEHHSNARLLRDHRENCRGHGIRTQ